MTGPEPVPLKALQRQLKTLADDLRKQSEAVPELCTWLHEQHAAATGRRSGETYEQWREDQLDQAAVAWLLGTVFVRFCEDNKLISRVFLAGSGDRTEAAVQAQTAYFMGHPTHNDRHWILEAFGYLRDLPATAGIFNGHNLAWKLPISADAASGLLNFWRRGDGVRSFLDPTLDTHFLGYLYQDLSPYARKRYALLQTPEFVVDFILKLTLDKSLKEYGLEETTLIDPTCGSGHFLLGAFERLYGRWKDEAPNLGRAAWATHALDQLTGIDINPFAVAITRFRLLVAAMRKCEIRSLETRNVFRIRVAAGDALLPWGENATADRGLGERFEGGYDFVYSTEDPARLAEYLTREQYTVVVGNPPYRIAQDRTLNKRYRFIYSTCIGKYSLSVPFVERFFQLVKREDFSKRAGFVGQLTSDSFMKREFGRRLIENYLATQVELDLIVDTSGINFPGHPTPTVMLFARPRLPRRRPVPALLAKQADMTRQNATKSGDAWAAILDAFAAHCSNRYVNVTSLDHNTIASFPWALGGNGAIELKAAIERASRGRLSDYLDGKIGFASFPGLDDAFVLPAATVRRLGLGWPVSRYFITGEHVRDWDLSTDKMALTPYGGNQVPLEFDITSSWAKHLWPFRTSLFAIVDFGGKTRKQIGHRWWTWYRWVARRYNQETSLVFAFKASHNHFAIKDCPVVLNRHAPVIQLRQEVGRDGYLALIGLLNSSTALFWLRQVCQPTILAPEAWATRYEIDGAKLSQFPLVDGPIVDRIEALHRWLNIRRKATSRIKCGDPVPTRNVIDASLKEINKSRRKMVALQEELDWRVYLLYGLVDEDLTVPDDSLPEIEPGERAFEFIMARQIYAGELKTSWFSHKRHRFRHVAEVPKHWPEIYRTVVERRIRVIEERPDIALIERPEYKRRWESDPWEVQEKEALRGWLLDRLEGEHLWLERRKARVLTVAQLADRIGVDADFRSVLSLYCGGDDYDLAAVLTRLVADKSVPFLAKYRYKSSGLRKRKLWECTWDLQRSEDNGEQVGTIPVPPKYANADFAKTSYWQNRGKLDVPKERFISYPKAERDSDKTPVIGWAGWNQLDQAQAVATLYVNRKNEEGWLAERLLPLLAGLVELEPWLHQWYAEPVAGYPGSPAAFYTTLIDTELAALGCGRADLVPEKLP